MKHDINYIQALEKAVKEKYGDLATMNPKHFWDENKEKDYIEQVKETVEKQRQAELSKEKVEVDGVLLPKKLINKNTDRVCSYCKSYSFNHKDDLYMSKFKACYKCYVFKLEDKQNG
jgi:phage-related protein